MRLSDWLTTCIINREVKAVGTETRGIPQSHFGVTASWPACKVPVVFVGFWSSLLYNGQQVIPGGKAAGAWRWQPKSTAEVRESVELYIYCLSGPSLKFTFISLRIFTSYFRRDTQISSFMKNRRVGAEFFDWTDRQTNGQTWRS